MDYNKFKSSVNVWVQRIWQNKILLGIFVVALALRVWGINYGLPLFLNIDEPATVSATFEIKDNLSPDRFDWPHLYLYMNFAVYAVYYGIRAVVSLFADVPWMSEPPAYLFVSRLLTAFLGALSVIPIYYSAKELFGSKKVAYLTAVVLAFLPIHANESHLAKLDIAQTFFACVSFYFIIKIFKYGQTKNFIWAGILIGLTTSVKYNGFLLFLPLLIAALLQLKNYKELFRFSLYKNLFLSGIVSIVAFYVGTPFALIDHAKFWSEERGVGALWQFQNVGKVTMMEYPFEVYETFAIMYKENLGLGLWIIFLLLLVLFLFFNKREKHYILTIFPVIILSLYVSTLERSPSHYYLTFVPMYVLALGIFINELASFVTAKTKLHQTVGFFFISTLVLLPSIYESLRDSFLYSQKDTRNSAYEWVKSHLNEEKDYLYVYGEDLAMVSFQKNNTEAIKKTDPDHINEANVPFYLIIGQNGIVRDEMIYGERDPEDVEGNSDRLLKYADLVFEQDTSKKLGPPIYIFYVKAIEVKTKNND